MQQNLIDPLAKNYNYGKLQYSNIIGKYLLNKIIQERGVETLLHYGINETKILKMINKGLLGGEVDLLWSIYYGTTMYEHKFIYSREYDFIKEKLPLFMQYFYIKPVFILSLTKGWSGTKLKELTADKEYYEVMFGQHTAVLNRKLFYDARVFLIIEMYKMLIVNRDITFQTLTTNLYSEDTKTRRLYYEWFSHLKLQEGYSQETAVKLMKHNKDGLFLITSLYKQLKQLYRQHGIDNIQSYLIDKTGPVIKKRQALKYVNFAAHGKLPCLLMDSFRQTFKDLYYGNDTTKTNPRLWTKV